MSNSKQPYAELQRELPSDLTSATAPSPPAYTVQPTARVTAMQPGTSGMLMSGTGEPMPTFTPININPNPPVGPKSTQLRCPQCKCVVKTDVRHRSTAKTHLACLLLSWTCICCCLPYCMDTCRNANHFCPMCGTFLGTYQS